MYQIIISSNSTLQRVYESKSRSLKGAIDAYGRCEGNETITIATKSGKVLSRAVYCWDGKYHRVCV